MKTPNLGLLFLFFLVGWVQISIPKTACGQTDSLTQIRAIKIRSEKKPDIAHLNPAQSIASADFLRYSAVNVADAVRNFSGVSIRDYGGIGGLKTISVRGLGANHTGVFIDGLPSGDAQNGQVDLGQISLFNVERIQLVNAQPAEILIPARAYAFASTLQISSSGELKWLGSSDFNAGLRGGSFGLLEPYIAFRQRIDGKWTSGVDAKFSTSNGKYRYLLEGEGDARYYARKNSDVISYQADGYIKYQRDSTRFFDAKAMYNQTERGLPNAVIFYNDRSSQRLWESDISVQYRYRSTVNNRISILASGKLGNKDVHYVDQQFLNIQGKLDQQYSQQEYYQSFAGQYVWSEAVNLSYAADAAINQLQTNLYQFAYPTRLSFWQAATADVTLHGVHIRTNLLHSLVHEWVKYGNAARSYSVFSPNVLASYQPFESDALILRGFYKDIFRAPTFNDLYYSRIGSSNLLPERARQTNLGATFNRTLSGKFSFIQILADAYRNSVSDKIIAVPNKDIFSWTMTNVGKVIIHGIDFQAKTAVAFNPEIVLLLNGNYSYQSALDVSDRGSFTYRHQIAYTPKHTYAINAGLELYNWNIGYNLMKTSTRYYLGENIPSFRLPGFAIHDLSISRKFYGITPITTGIEINNLFNKRYEMVRSFPMPGRSFRLSFFIKL